MDNCIAAVIICVALFMCITVTAYIDSTSNTAITVAALNNKCSQQMKGPYKLWVCDDVQAATE